MPTAVKYLSSKKKGMPIDIAEQALKDEGWLYKDESLMELLRNPENLKRDQIGKGIEEKKPSELSPKERELKKQMEKEPEAPPKGEYITIRAEDLPKGKKLTLIENKSREGWDVYKVEEKDPFEIKLIDGETITLKPHDEVQVLKSEVEKPKEKPKAEKKEEIKKPEKPKEYDKYEGIQVEVTGVQAKTGKKIKYQEDAKTALEQIDSDIETLYQMLECVT